MLSVKLERKLKYLLGNRKYKEELVAQTDNTELAANVIPALNLLASRTENSRDSDFSQAINLLSSRVDGLGSNSDLVAAVNLLATRTNSSEALVADLVAAVNLLSAKCEKQATAIRDLASKLDAEDVTNLDTDYEAIVDPNL